MRWQVRPSGIAGEAAVPGDKSISHRALMLAALADGTSSIRGLGDGEDVASTVACLRALRVRIERSGDQVCVQGGALRPPSAPLDAGNSGTTMRLLSGILAGQPFDSVVTGDASLCRRPMGRIARPLMEMGTQVDTEDGHAPIRIRGGRLRAIRYRCDPPSAQVKSCVLLAGLFAEGSTSVWETVATRDHTERLMRATGIAVDAKEQTVAVHGPARPRAFDLCVPGDLSSAAFLLAGAAIAGVGDVTVRDVGLNPTRTGFLQVLRRMGCDLETSEEREEGGEPVGSIRVRPAPLTGVEIGADEAATMLDELPLVALLGTVAAGETRVTGAGELRVKESDRIATVAAELGRLGAAIEEQPDGFRVRGSRLQGTRVQSHGDHRVAMMLGLAGLIAAGETIVEGAEAAAVSFPCFGSTMRGLGGMIHDA